MLKKVLGLAFVLLALSSSAVLARENNAQVCTPGKDSARCHARVIIDRDGKPSVGGNPSGYGSAQFLSAYGLGGGVASSSGTIIAIVDAYDHPNIKSDLDRYSSQFGLPALGNCAVGTSTPCFQKVDQRGGTAYPAKNVGWALEISLDVEIAHGICQNCSILLVEADSNSFADLMSAVDRAHLMGAKVISNSYGTSEFSGQGVYDSHFNLPGTAITFSSGDAGYGVEYPAASNFVTAVGGTTLNLNGNTYISESAWNGAGSGCSAFELKPVWQTDPLCAMRTVADISADADPATGAAIYDSVRYQGRSGWFKVGGTSLAAPLVAGVYALSNNTAGAANSIPYFNTALLHDIVGGSNGSCGGSYVCTALSGYDGPTGLGSPRGFGGF